MAGRKAGHRPGGTGNPDRSNIMPEIQFQLRDGEIIDGSEAKSIIYDFLSDDAAKMVSVDGRLPEFETKYDVADAIEESDTFKVTCTSWDVRLELQSGADCQIIVDGLRPAQGYRSRWFAIPAESNA